MTQRAAGSDKDWEQGRQDGEVAARLQGTTYADLHMVPVVQGSQMYKAGYRQGFAKVRNERYNQEVQDELASRAMNQGYGI